MSIRRLIGLPTALALMAVVLNGGGGTDSFKADTGNIRKSVERAGTCP